MTHHFTVRPSTIPKGIGIKSIWDLALLSPSPTGRFGVYEASGPHCMDGVNVFGEVMLALIVQQVRLES